MSDDTLPSLPEKVLLCRFMPDDHRYGDVRGYTADQLRTYGQSCADAAIERCAQVCEAERIKRPLDARGDAYNKALEDAAASILALKGQPT